MHEHWTGEALLLSQVASRDDQIIRMLTSTGALIPSIAYRARRPKRGQTMAATQPLSHVNLSLRRRPNRELAELREITLIEDFQALKGDLFRLGVASLMSEAILNLVPDWAHEPGLYPLLHRALTYLNHTEHEVHEGHLALFEWRLLSLSGLMPEPDALPYISATQRDILVQWQLGHWPPITPSDASALCQRFEILLIDATGRPLRSRSVLNALQPPPQPTRRSDSSPAHDAAPGSAPARNK